MAAATAHRTTATRALNNKSVETFAIATSETIYQGCLVTFDTNGRLQDATAEASRRPAGVVEEIVNESGAAITAATGNTAGTIKAKVAWGHEALFDVLTAARTYANLGKNVFVKTNQEVSDTTGAGTAGVRIKLGQVVEFANSSKSAAWIAIRVYGDADAT